MNNKIKKDLQIEERYSIIKIACESNIIMAPWSSGQDASLSRWNQGFDSPRSHYKKP